MARSTGKLGWYKSELIALSLSVTAIGLAVLVSQDERLFLASDFKVVTADSDSKEHTAIHSSLPDSTAAVSGRSPNGAGDAPGPGRLLSRWVSWETRLPFFTRQPAVEVSIQVPAPVLPEVALEASPGAPLSFTDVGPDHWANPVLDELSAHGLIAGLPDGAFQPDRPITRLELAVQVARLFQLSKQPTIGFKDISSTHWAHGSIHAAAQMGFFKGDLEHYFQPAATISRAELLIAIAAGLQLEPPPEPAQALRQFRDHDQVPAWAAASTAAALQAGIVVNYPSLDYLHPQAAATRAEAAAMLYQSLVYLGKFRDRGFPYAVSASPGNPSGEAN